MENKQDRMVPIEDYIYARKESSKQIKELQHENMKLICQTNILTYLLGCKNAGITPKFAIRNDIEADDISLSGFSGNAPNGIPIWTVLSYWWGPRFNLIDRKSSSDCSFSSSIFHLVDISAMATYPYAVIGFLNAIKACGCEDIEIEYKTDWKTLVLRESKIIDELEAEETPDCETDEEKDLTIISSKGESNA